MVVAVLVEVEVVVKGDVSREDVDKTEVVVITVEKNVGRIETVEDISSVVAGNVSKNSIKDDDQLN